MDNRMRILNTAAGKATDRKPVFFMFGPWPEAEARWRQEGMDKPYPEALGLDAGFRMIDVNLGYLPSFEPQVLEDKDGIRIVRDALGITMRVRTDGASIPQYLDYPIKAAEDWPKLRARLDPDDPARFPENWPELVRSYRETSCALQLGQYPYGLFGTLRDMMGVENLLINFYDEPELIHEIMDYLTDFWLAIYEKVARDVRVDMIHMWEDMSGKTGPLISPKMIREFMTPNYRKIRDFADRHGIPLFSVDTDGDCHELVEPFMEGGVNMLYPFEVQAGCDVNEYVRRYPELCVVGGFNKQALWQSEEAIDSEFERIRGVFVGGARYIPSPDHLIPPEVPYRLICHYVKKLKEFVHQ